MMVGVFVLQATTLVAWILALNRLNGQLDDLHEQLVDVRVEP